MHGSSPMKVSSFEASPPFPAPPGRRHVLVVESDADQRRRVVTQLTHWGYTPHAAASAEEALELVARVRFAFALVAIRLPGTSGIELVRRARDLREGGPVIMVAEPGQSAQIVEAIQAGADDFVRRPYTAEDVETAIRGLGARLRREPASAADHDERLARELGLLVSPQMREIQAVVEQAARAGVTVLICGETGVGKEVVARAIHTHSPRRRAAFVKVNCAAMPRELLESELFGHERGAFTGAHQRKPGRFELADGGTIFLDEIGDLALELQPKLLKVLETKTFRRLGGTHELQVDVRLVAATNRDLTRAVQQGRFREDLLYRLSVMPLHLPALRDRSREDRLALLTRLLTELRPQLAGCPAECSSEALDRLLGAPWPGNVREMRNVLERAMILARGQETLGVEHLPADLRKGAAVGSGGDRRHQPQTLADLERVQIERALRYHSGNRTRAALELGISRATLINKIKAYALDL